MKTAKTLVLVFALVALVYSCKNDNKEETSTFTVTQADTEPTKRTGQAFIKDDGSTTVLSIAIGSKDHTTLVAAVQAAQLENVLVNAGPLMVFAPTNEAFAALP
ncbi:fasciclin domain-containing protein, partial [Psychroserpens sp.]